jgi:hypothetical protein
VTAVEPYEIRYTTLARTFLGECFGAFEERARGELAELMGAQGEMADLLFHSLEFDGRLFVATWHDEGWLLIDSASEEESEIPAGPRIGQKIIVPRPDTESQ